MAASSFRYGNYGFKLNLANRRTSSEVGDSRGMQSKGKGNARLE